MAGVEAALMDTQMLGVVGAVAVVVLLIVLGTLLVLTIACWHDHLQVDCRGEVFHLLDYL